MIYKTHKDIYRNVAGKLNLDEEVISAIGEFYWEDVAQRVSNLNVREIYLNKLGVFRLRKAQSDRYIAAIPKVEAMMRGHHRTEEAIQAFLDKAKWKKDQIERMLEEWYKIKELRDKHREFKKCLQKSLKIEN